MGAKYSAVFGPTAVTTLAALVEISAPADAVVRLHSVRVGQSSDAGDAQAEMLNVSISRFSASGTGGTLAVTADPLEVGSPAAGSTVDTGHTTLGTGENPLVEDCFNVQAGWLWIPTPDEIIVASPSGVIGVVVSARADSLTMTCTAVFEEIGG